jgi:hypothetical protein
MIPFLRGQPLGIQVRMPVENAPCLAGSVQANVIGVTFVDHVVADGGLGGAAGFIAPFLSPAWLQRLEVPASGPARDVDRGVLPVHTQPGKAVRVRLVTPSEFSDPFCLHCSVRTIPLSQGGQALRHGGQALKVNAGSRRQVGGWGAGSAAGFIAPFCFQPGCSG